MPDGPEADQIVTGDELVARARALAPALRDRQEACERDRRVPAESMAEMVEARLFRLMQPRAFGGFELGLDDFLRVSAEIGAGCGSTAWVYATGAQHQWMIGMFPLEAQHELWDADPDVHTASSFAPTGSAVRTDGGWRLTGRWSFCSGVDHARWMIVGARLADGPDAAPAGLGFVLVPAGDYAVDDDWHVLGLAGTGSKSIVVEDRFVPAHRLLTMEDAVSGRPPGVAINPGDLFKIPFFSAVSICLCGPALGMAQGALEDYVAATAVRQTRGAALSGPQAMGDYATIQLRVGEAAAGIDAARQLVLRDCAGIMETIAAGRALDEPTRARNKADLGFAVKLAKHAVDLLFESGGGQGLYAHNRVQRYWRDIHAAAKHLSLAFDATGAVYGRVLLGRPAGTTQF